MGEVETIVLGRGHFDCCENNGEFGLVFDVENTVFLGLICSGSLIVCCSNSMLLSFKRLDSNFKILELPVID